METFDSVAVYDQATAVFVEASEGICRCMPKGQCYRVIVHCFDKVMNLDDLEDNKINSIPNAKFIAKTQNAVLTFKPLHYCGNGLESCYCRP